MVKAINILKPLPQTTHIAYPGENIMEVSVVLELKSLADVDLIGLPNAGKSKLLSVIAAVNVPPMWGLTPHIGNHSFAPLVSNLGV